jgi:aspartate aminotransferase-like enzyme
MYEFGRFFLPGPTEVRPEILAAQTHPTIGHRTPELAALLSEADRHLRPIFGTTRPVFISTSSGTGMMEASVRNAVRRRALCLVNGAFSARYRDLVLGCGRECEVYEVPLGEAHEPEEVERRLRAGGFDALTVVHSETSSGVLNPIAEIAAAVRSAERATGEEILVLVDGVSSVGGMLVETDEWGVDFLLTGSQKALALPPGLAFGTPSERLLERAATLAGRGLYFDLLEYAQHWEEHQTTATPAVTLLYALSAQLRHIVAETMEARAARHLAMAESCWSWAEARGRRWGLRVMAPEGRRSPTVTALALPPERKGSVVAARLKERGYTLATGYGAHRDQALRIGHMGDHTVLELELLLAELESVLGEVE